MRAELIWTTVIPDLWAIDLTVPGHTSAAPLTRVPASSGARELQMRTGIPRSFAGWIVLGCSTFAPKYASSAASAYDRLGMVRAPRSEEHTSELQSQSNLVCRLLLEKKKTK